MALDRLAPDQRAVVQLVLQQERSYDELADLLGISAEAVRERARKGLERLDEGGPLDEEARGRITDYLLGQQTVSGREATRELLAGNPDARAWAQTVAGELGAVARSPLPEIPEAGPAARPAVATPAVEPEPAAAPPEPPVAEAPARPVRARPRPRPEDDRPKRPSPPRRAGEERPRSSLVGGALLIGGVALVVLALVAWLVWGGDDDPERGDSASTPTATATPSVQPAGQIALRQPGGGDARGQMTIFVSDDGQVAFTIEGNDMPDLERGEAYAMWLTGGARPHRLGFITDDTPGDGNIGSSGPQERDAQRFPQWLAEAEQVLVTRETTQEGSEPGAVVLRGTIPGAGEQGGQGGGG